MDALIHHLERKEDLSPREVTVAAELLLDPAAPDEKKAALLEALSRKGETPAEIAGFVEVFLEHARSTDVFSMSEKKAATETMGPKCAPCRSLFATLLCHDNLAGCHRLLGAMVTHEVVMAAVGLKSPPRGAIRIIRKKE